VAAVERIRVQANRQINPASRSALGQYLTPGPVAAFIASMFGTHRKAFRLLDPGAGVGSLTAAFVARAIDRQRRPEAISVTAYEIDVALADHLKRTMALCRDACTECGIEFLYEIRLADYIADRADAGRELFVSQSEAYDCVIMNPPYGKIHSESATRRQLRSLSIETTNLYTGFMLLAARQLAEGGEFVSINPRSFCNGPYFRPFRKAFLGLIALKTIHVFESRSEVFKADDVLQENVIVHGRRNATKPATVVVSLSAADGAVMKRRVGYEQVVRPDDPDSILHVTADERADQVGEQLSRFIASLADLGLGVATGRVVDFRARTHLRSQPGDGTVPLVYPAHFCHGLVEWPNGHTRKPNAIAANERTADLLVRAGFYVLTKRFSAKEERRRLVAAIYDPRRVHAAQVGFENHLNYYHKNGGGLPEEIARGLAIYLNSTLLDQYFRQFSGHTQVNATDLRRLPYPNTEQLRKLAGWCESLGDQAAVDAALDRLLHSV